MHVCTHTESHNTQTQAHTGKEAHIHRYTDTDTHTGMQVHMGYYRHADIGILELTYIVKAQRHTHTCMHTYRHAHVHIQFMLWAKPQFS